MMERMNKKSNVLSLTMEELDRVNGGQMKKDWWFDVIRWVEGSLRRSEPRSQMINDIKGRWESFYGPSISDNCSQEDLREVLNYIDEIC